MTINPQTGREKPGAAFVFTKQFIPCHHSIILQRRFIGAQFAVEGRRYHIAIGHHFVCALCVCVLLPPGKQMCRQGVQTKAPLPLR